MYIMTNRRVRVGGTGMERIMKKALSEQGVSNSQSYAVDL